VYYLLAGAPISTLQDDKQILWRGGEIMRDANFSTHNDVAIVDLSEIFHEIEDVEVERSAFFGVVSCCNKKGPSEW